MAFIRCGKSGGSGGSGGNFVHGSYVASSSEGYTVNCGFQPKYICIGFLDTVSSNRPMSVYHYDRNTTRVYNDSGTSMTTSNLPNTSNSRIGNVTSTGFTINKTSSSLRGSTVYYFAME